MYYVFSCYNNEFHMTPTLKDAESWAQTKLDEFKKDATEDGWPEGVDQIVIGKVLRTSVKTKIVTKPSDIDCDGYSESYGDIWPSTCDEMCDYEIMAIEPPRTFQAWWTTYCSKWELDESDDEIQTIKEACEMLWSHLTNGD